MFRNFISCYCYRGISKSSICRNLEKVKPKESDNLSPSAEKGSLFDFVPNKVHKKILVLSGRYKSEKDIPPRISHGVLDNARSRLRIRISNLLIVLTLTMFGFSIWLGKKKHREGDSILKRMLNEDKKILANANKKEKENIES